MSTATRLNNQSVLYRVETPQGFIGFRKDGGNLYWVQSGDDWARLVAGHSGAVTVTGSDQFTSVIRSHNLVGSVPPTGFLSTQAQTAWRDRSAAQTRPSTPNPANTPVGSITGPAQVGPAPRPSGGGGSTGGGGGSTGGGSAGGTTQPTLPPPVDGPDTQVTPRLTAAEFALEMSAAFPWIESIGLGVDWFRELAATSASPDMVLAKLRQSPQYRSRFAGIFRADGSLRMNEGQYMATETNYRQLLNQFGFGDRYDQRNPASLIGFFENEIDPNELKDRLEVYRGLEEGSRYTRDAFYVYAGMDVSVDDLFGAIVDPAAAQRLTDEYNARVAAQTFDYQTFITRATELGLQRVAEDLTDMQRRGAVTGQVVQSILNTAPDFARQIMDAIYTGGTGNTQGQMMDLQDLLSSFEYAALGSAASQVGLELPTLERVQQIREAGIQRTQALRGYQEFAQSAGTFTAALQRVRGQTFGQDDFERGAFLGDATASRNMGQAMQAERAAGQGTNTFRFDQDRTGRFTQQGLRP